VGEERPRVRLPNLTLEPGRDALTVDDLIRNTKRGFYVLGIRGSSDQQLLNGQFVALGVRAIRNGQLDEPIRDMAIQFMTPAFWRSLDALGGAASAHTGLHSTGLSGTDPLQLASASVSTVPGRFRQVNVLNTGQTA
jgi:TldD protein